MRCFSLSAVIPIVACAFLLAPRASATVVDLTRSGSSGDIGAAHFIQGSTGSGTGNIEPFLRVQRLAVERGVNSDGPYTMNEKAGSWTRSTLVSAFGVADLHGASAIRFLLDINENDRQGLLSLDYLKVFVAPVSTYNTLAQLNANATLIYDLGSSKVLLNHALEAVSGSSDMTAYLPYDLFISHRTEYLYLYCKFGLAGRMYGSDGGFEEWSTAGDTPVVGACCTGDQQCEVVPESDCETQGGTYQGGMSTCDPDACRQPTGACCFADGSCVMQTAGDCAALGGFYQADGTVCDPNSCAQPTGVCCLPEGLCIVLTANDCVAQGGTYSGDGSVCDPSSCRSVPTHRRSWGQIKNEYHR